MNYIFKATAKMLDIEPSKVEIEWNHVSEAEILGAISYFKEKQIAPDMIRKFVLPT